MKPANERDANLTLIASIVAWLLVVCPAIMVSSDQSNAAPCFLLATGDNDVIDDLELFSQDYTELGEVPDNVFLMTTTVGGNTNATLNYDYGEAAIEYTVTEPANLYGELWISEIEPAVYSTISMTYQFDRDNVNGYVKILLANGWLNYYLLANSTHQLTSYYYQPTLLSTSIYVGATDDDILTVNFDYNGANHTLRTYAGNRSMYTPAKDADIQALAYPSILEPCVRFDIEPFSICTTGTLYLYELTQTIPERSVTAIPYTAQSFGLDGPHGYSTLDTGVAYLTANGGAGTLWFDWGYNEWKSGSVFETYIDLIENHSWDVGVHFTVGLTGLSLSDAYSLMDNEITNITGVIGSQPTTWCSLGNADNVTHANYLWSNYGMRWRNEIANAHASNIDLLYNETWEHYWSPASAAGATYPCYTHELDEEPAILYSIDASKFTFWVDNMTAAATPVVGFEIYRTINGNTGEATFASVDITGQGYFETNTNGGDALVRVGSNLLWSSEENQTLYAGYSEFIVGDGEEYASGVAATPGGANVLTISNYVWNASSSTIASWTAWDDTPATYTVTASSESSYKVYLDGGLLATGLGATFSFTANSGGEFTVVVWGDRQVSAMVIITVNMVGLGIVMAVVGGWVMPLAKDVQKGKYSVRPEKLIPEVVKCAMFIIVAVSMWVFLKNVAIG